jgi:hypothetical protein
MIRRSSTVDLGADDDECLIAIIAVPGFLDITSMFDGCFFFIATMEYIRYTHIPLNDSTMDVRSGDQ